MKGVMWLLYMVVALVNPIAYGRRILSTHLQEASFGRGIDISPHGRNLKKNEPPEV